MAIAIKNTFLDYTDHKFLGFHSSERRSQSVPRSWKPVGYDSCEDKHPVANSSTCSTHSQADDLESLETVSYSSEDFYSADYLPCQLPDYLTGCSPCTPMTDSTIRPERVKLTSAAAAFQPMSSKVIGDTRMDTVISCIHMALVACGQTQQINVDKSINGSTWFSVDLKDGPQACERSYEVIQLAKKALELIAPQLHDTNLLNARVQKEDWGYSLRSSVVFTPEHARDSMCWDTFTCGRCPRRGTCRWYHPQEADIRRIKVSIRCQESWTETQCDNPVGRTSSSEKCKISLGELVQ